MPSTTAVRCERMYGRRGLLTDQLHSAHDHVKLPVVVLLLGVMDEGSVVAPVPFTDDRSSAPDVPAFGMLALVENLVTVGGVLALTNSATYTYPGDSSPGAIVTSMTPVPAMAAS